MSDNKKYYYLKLKDNFFDSDQMIVLESMPDGYKYSNILLKLYLRSLKNDGKLMFNDRIPYNSTILSQVTRHSVGDVEKAVNIFTELGLIEILENGAIYMLDIQNFIGESSTEGDRKRAYRRKIDQEKSMLLNEGQMSDKSPDVYPPEIEIEKEIDKELDKELDSNNSQQSQKRYADDSQYMKVAVYLFEKIKERLPNKKEPDFQKWADEVRKTVELDGVPVERYKEVLDWSQNDDFWQANILSTNKLRKKFDTIYLQMQRDKKQKPQKVTFQNTRNSQEDTEITPEMMKAYEELKQNERT